MAFLILTDTSDAAGKFIVNADQIVTVERVQLDGAETSRANAVVVVINASRYLVRETRQAIATALAAIQP